MGSYRYLVADTRTGLTLDELPLSVDSFGQEIGEGGTLSGTLALGDMGSRDWASVTVPFKTSIHVLRDDNLVVWGGPIIGREPSGTDQATIRAETFEAFLKRRKIKTAKTYTAVDVFDIVRDILDTIQGYPGGGLGITIPPDLAGWTQTVAYAVTDRAVVWDEILRLLETGNRAETYITVYRDMVNGNFIPTMHLGTPQANAGLPPVVLEYPGNVISYTYPEVGEANAVMGLGKGDGVSKVMFEAVDTLGQIAQGWPLVDADYSAGEEDDLARLTARTKIELATNLVDNVVPQVVINGDQPGIEFGSFPLGIACRLRAVSLYHPAGVNGAPSLDITRRIMGWSVKPPSDGGVEEVTLTLGSGLGRFRPPMDNKRFHRWLSNLERRVRVSETRR